MIICTRRSFVFNLTKLVSSVDQSLLKFVVKFAVTMPYTFKIHGFLVVLNGILYLIHML